MSDAAVRIAYILHTAAMGGTELYLTTLVRHLDANRFAPTWYCRPQQETYRSKRR